jgi:hypothetical protein
VTEKDSAKSAADETTLVIAGTLGLHEVVRVDSAADLSAAIEAAGGKVLSLHDLPCNRVFDPLEFPGSGAHLP